MTNLFSLTHRSGRKFPSRWAHQTAWHNTLPGFASARETASANEPFGVQRLTARYRQISREINELAADGRTATDVDLCPTDSPIKTILDLHASAARGASPETPGKANGNKEVNAF